MTILEDGLFAEGKTKWVFGVKGKKGLCILRAKDAVTKNDDPDATVTLEGKGGWSTATTCASFRLLRKAGLPVAFHRRLSPVDMLAPLCRMIPLECIARRVAEGSYCKRNPDIKKGHRFERLKIEFFAKTTAGSLRPFNGDDAIAIMPPNPANKDGRPDDDPLITNPESDEWVFAHSKTGVIISMGLPSATVLPEGVTIAQLEELTRKAFLVLEKGWAALGWPMSDFKIEFGVDSKGKLCIADVVDADSWRLYDNKGNQMSKQIWRDSEPLEKLAAVYRKVAKMAQRLRVPNQAIVFWKEQMPDFDPKTREIPGVHVIVMDRTGDAESGFPVIQNHMKAHPDGGVIITSGKSLARGIRLTRLATCPVIHMETSETEEATNSAGPLLRARNCQHAFDAAFGVLGITNPAAYAEVQYQLEQRLKK